MKKYTKIIAGLTAAVLSLGVAAGCTKNTNYPKFINNEASSGVKREKYNVRVQSIGGAKLDNVKVTVKKPDGTVARRAISLNGLIELDLPLDEYTLEVDETSLPAGYRLENKTYKTSATSREDVLIEIPSRLIGADESGCTYSLGGIMKDFTFTDYSGKKHVLSEILEEKAAVVINFWYTGCGPCRSEFPAIQRAYAMRTDVEILAICSTHQGDTNTKVQQFADELGLTFPAGVDDQGLITSFGVGSFPTTYVIDRYGMIAERTVGSETKSSEWTNLFEKYASPNYVQNVSGSSNDDNNNVTEMVKPNVTMPSSAEMDAAASVSGSPLGASYRNDESEFSWPWLNGSDSEGSYIYSSNKGVGNSYSIVYAGEIEMKKDQVLLLEYKVDSEAGNDLLHVMIDGMLVSGRGWSAVTQWTPVTVYVADRDKKVELSFSYVKDPGDPDDFKGEDQAKIRNIHVADKSTITEPTDILRTCASGNEVISGKKAMYEYYTDVVLGDDGFYHKDDKNGPIIYITLNNVTPWSDLHTGGTTEDDDGNRYYNSLYMMTYYRYADTTDNNFSVVLDGKDLTYTVISYWTISALMESPYYLMPVTPQLKEWAEEFTKRYEAEIGSETHGKEWLEFCYYYDHYGAEHDNCHKSNDPTRGLTIYNSYTAYQKGDANLVASEMYNKDTGRNKAVVNFALNINNGTYYKFTPTETGVYNIRSYTKGCGSTEVSPSITIMNSDGDIIEGSQFVRDFDSKVTEDEGRVEYEGFNHYTVLEKGVPVYLHLEVAPSTTGYYDFEIEYLGTSYKKMYVASTYAGAWSSATRYSAIRVAYDSNTDCYYKADAQNNPIYDQPIYISMVHESFLYSEASFTDPITGEYESSTYKSPEWLINVGVFREMYGNPHAKMVEYLNRAKANVDGIVDENGKPVMGLLKANAELVELFNKFVDEYIDSDNIGRGEGNAWLTFACYIEHFGE